VLLAPYCTVAVFALAAETRAEAERLFGSREVWRAERESGRFIPLPSPEDAAGYAFSEAQIRRNGALRERAAMGTPDVVQARLAAIAGELDVDEIVIVTAVHNAAARRRSFALLAHAGGV
jgi:alkanesulfonate monooxygenase SsuD/methylene tetrahydromethanopterin reductase-like flavin-dependent oxidoreductase (luciferase family)